MTKPLWQRSIYVDTKGMGWTKAAGLSAEFIHVLFMHGYSLFDIHAGLDAVVTPKEIEDAIRYGLEKGRAA